MTSRPITTAVNQMVLVCLLLAAVAFTGRVSEARLGRVHARRARHLMAVKPMNDVTRVQLLAIETRAYSAGYSIAVGKVTLRVEQPHSASAKLLKEQPALGPNVYLFPRGLNLSIVQLIAGNAIPSEVYIDNSEAISFYNSAPERVMVDQPPPVFDLNVGDTMLVMYDVVNKRPIISFGSGTMAISDDPELISAIRTYVTLASTPSPESLPLAISTSTGPRSIQC